MDLNLLKVFVSVANNKSISIAANELKCAQSNVTSRVKQLEKVLGLEVEKNFTDGERAIRYAVEKGYNDIVIYGAYGGKIEHILGNIALLKIAKNLGARAVIKDGENLTRLLTGKVSLTVKKNSAFSLIPYGEECVFAKSYGLYYPLDNLTLTNGDTRGISNVAVRESVDIEIVKRECLAIYGRKNI